MKTQFEACEELVGEDTSFIEIVIYCAVATFFVVSTSGWALSGFQFPTAFKVVISAIATILIILVVNLLSSRRRRNSMSGREFSAQAWFPLLSFGLLFASFWMIGNQVPAFGWDALDFWLPASQAILESEAQFKFYLDAGILPESRGANRHGAILPSAVALFVSMAPEGAKLYYGFCFLHVVLLTFLYSLNVTGEIVYSSLVALLVLTTPLLGNHLFIYGYSELPSTAALLSAAVLMDIGLRQNRVRKSFFALAIIILVCAILMRSTFVVYASIVCIALLCAFLETHILYRRSCKTMFSGPVVIIGVVVAVVVMCVFESSSALYGFTDHGRLIFAGRIVRFADTEFPSAMKSISHALFFNSSFSILVVAIIVSCISIVLRKITIRRLKMSLESRTIFPYIFIGTVFYGVILLYTRYGVAFGSTVSDTFLSRSLMPLLILSSCSIHWAIRSSRFLSTE